MSRNRVTVSADHPSSYALRAAVLVYATGTGGAAYATVHEVEAGRRPRLGAGVPATKEACAGLARALGAAATLSGFVPPTLLYLGARSLVWWRPAAPAVVYFDTAKSAAADQADDAGGRSLIGKRSARVPHPGLVFAVGRRGWYVYALAAGADRPGPATRLMRAPYFNVYADGQICTGNVRLPKTLSPESLAEYERAFFASEFTHPNAHGRERLVRAEGGPYAFWRDLLDLGPGMTEFPAQQLVDAKLTLEGLVARIEKGGDRD